MKRESVKRSGPRGFTLVEILVVLAILVLLASLVVPRFLGSQKEADKKNARIQIAGFEKALELYAGDTRSFPATEEGLEALVERPTDLKEGVAWNGPYLKGGEIPKDPWGREYQYEYDSAKDEPRIWSDGPDADDESDDICSWTKGKERGERDGTVRTEKRGKERRIETTKESRKERRPAPRKETTEKTTVSSRAPKRTAEKE